MEFLYGLETRSRAVSGRNLRIRPAATANEADPKPVSTLQIDCVWPKLTELDKTPEHGHQSCITYLLHDAKAKFGQLLDTARREPVVIERHGRAVAVVLSKEDFDELNALKLERLCTEIAAEVVAVEAGEYTDYDEENLMQLGERIKAEGRKTHSAK